MFTDTRDIPPGTKVEADVCVIGGGAAGISLAMDFADSSTRLVLLENGGGVAERTSRPMYQVVPRPSPRLADDPERPWFFGGGTNHWAGNCRPLDDVDFEPRGWIPHSGWPIRREELVPYYERAQPMVGLGDVGWYDLEACLPHLDHPPLGVDPAVLTSRIMQRGSILSLAELHRQRLEASRNVEVMLHAQALRFRTNAAGDRVDFVEIVGRDEARLRVEAEMFVLAAGGVENARLLLCSDDLNRNGGAYNHDLTGRFFMEHWYLDIPLGGWGNGLDLTFYNSPQEVGSTGVWAQLALSEELMRAERLPGLSVWFHSLPRTTPGVVAARRIAASLLRRTRPELLTDLRLVLGDSSGIIKHLLGRPTRRGAPASDGHFLRVQLEQTPDPDNRIQLSEKKSEFGQPHVELVLGLDEGERRRHIRGLRLAADEIGLNGARIARQMSLMLDAGRLGFFWHHMGTTRMSSNPELGVVDADCRVHGISNLFAAGSSVFPTAGTAAPTLTIVALARRLADHIRRLRGGAASTRQPA